MLAGLSILHLTTAPTTLGREFSMLFLTAGLECWDLLVLAQHWGSVPAGCERIALWASWKIGSGDNRLHALCEQVRPSSLVFDPYVGTGSILVAAAHLGAHTLGCDIDMRVIRDGKQVSAGRRVTIWPRAPHSVPALAALSCSLTSRWCSLGYGVVLLPAALPPEGCQCQAGQ